MYYRDLQYMVMSSAYRFFKDSRRSFTNIENNIIPDTVPILTKSILD